MTFKLTKKSIKTLFLIFCIFNFVKSQISTSLAEDRSLLNLTKYLENELDAKIGIAIIDLKTNEKWIYNGNTRFPLNSTFKTLACAAMLSKVDRKIESLNRVIKFDNKDLVEYSPITKNNVGNTGMKLSEICYAAMTMSDNTAANLILNSLGGPNKLTKFLRSNGDTKTRLDRYETALNSSAPGDIRDTTTPYAMAKTLQILLFSDILSPQSKQLLSNWMINNRVSKNLIRSILPVNWIIGDRTGAGNNGSRSINAILWPPNRQPVIVNIYITDTTAPFADRNAAIVQLGQKIISMIK